MTRTPIRTAMMLLALACTSLPGPSAASDVSAFVGSWSITEARTAPWEDPDNPMLDAGEADYIGKTVTIGADSMTGPDMLGCGKTTMDVSAGEFAGLFEGGLATDPKDPTKFDPEKAVRLARELGFSAEPVPTLVTGCSELLLHLRDKATILFGLNNRIFVMQRQ